MSIRLLSALAGAAALAWGAGFTVSQIRGAIKDVDAKGFERGSTAMALAQSQAVEKARREGEERLAAEKARTAAAIETLTGEAAAARAKAAAAIASLKAREPLYEQCDRLPWPAELREHHP